jgi:hypothetical protein
LDFITGTNTAITDNALRRIEFKVRGAGVFFEVSVVVAVVAIANIAKANNASHVLKFTVTICRTRQAIEWVIGDVELHNILAKLGQLSGLSANYHAFFGRSCTGGRSATTTVDFD